MASGLIGTSTAIASNGTINGSVISYNCPGSGVRYAVLSIHASCSVGGGSPNSAQGFCSAGNLVCNGYSGNVSHGGSSTAVASSYSVILGPNGSWAGTTSAFMPNNAGISSASLTASVLEVV